MYEGARKQNAVGHLTTLQIVLWEIHYRAGGTYDTKSYDKQGRSSANCGTILFPVENKSHTKTYKTKSTGCS